MPSLSKALMVRLRGGVNAGPGSGDESIQDSHYAFGEIDQAAQPLYDPDAGQRSVVVERYRKEELSVHVSRASTACRRWRENRWRSSG